MAYTLEEDHSDAGYDLAGGIYGTWYLCQTFTASGSYDLKKIDIPLCSEGTPPSLYIEIWSTSGGEPDSVLKSQSITGELSAYPSHDWVETVITAAYTTTEDDVYAIVVRSDGTGDSDNRGRWWYDSSGSWAGAEGWSNDSGSTWNMTASADHLFKIYSPAGPIKAKTPAPIDTATGLTLDYQQFSWESGSETPPDEEVYNVYWGTASGELDTLILDEGSLTYMASIYILAALGTGLYNETYYWRVDTYWPSTDETADGDEWTVSTIAFSPPLPTGITLTGGDGDEGDPTGTPSGLNFMTAIRRLVVAANSKIWYESI